MDYSDADYGYYDDGYEEFPADDETDHNPVPPAKAPELPDYKIADIKFEDFDIEMDEATREEFNKHAWCKAKGEDQCCVSYASISPGKSVVKYLTNAEKFWDLCKDQA